MKITTETKKLIDIAMDIIDENEGVLLSGSLGLKELGIQLRREPKDIDLYLPYGQSLHLIPGMVEETIETEEDYDNLYYDRRGFKVGTIQVDVFTPREESGELKLADENSSIILAAHLIIGFKVQHTLSESGNTVKHQNDIIHILINN